MGKKVTITLTVNASALWALTNPNQTQIDAECSLSDDNSGSSSSNIENFESEVYINNDVKWQGETNDSGYSVAITSIVYEAGVNNDVNFFDNTTINGTGGRTGNVTAKVKNDSNLLNKLDVYTINFSIYNSGNSSKPFSIDPKLKISTTQ